jgi:hypothetical protein
MSMFGYQCQETAKNTGCTTKSIAIKISGIIVLISIIISTFIII